MMSFTDNLRNPKLNQVIKKIKFVIFNFIGFVIESNSILLFQKQNYDLKI